MTHTYAILEVSENTYNEIAAKLREAGYENQFNDRDSVCTAVIDMHGIALVKEKEKHDNKSKMG